MPALREAVSRFFSPGPGPEAAVVRQHAERLKSAAAELEQHQDTFAELVRNVQGGASVPKRKSSKRAGRSK